jgi:hypothetical protein
MNKVAMGGLLFQDGLQLFARVLRMRASDRFEQHHFKLRTVALRIQQRPGIQPLVPVRFGGPEGDRTPPLGRELGKLAKNLILT